MRKAYLVLQDGTVFEGKGFGATGSCVGELVFNTAVVGYIESLTDPAYYGQILLQTFPMVGNYGMIEEDVQGKCCVKGYVVREWCEKPSNFRCEYDLDTYLKQQGVPGIYGVDTRALTRILRDKGVQNAIITDTLPADLAIAETYTIEGAVEAVTTTQTVTYSADQAKYNTVMLDLGVKQSLITELNDVGCSVTLVPASTSAADILAMKPDGVILSGGPGDPAKNPEIVNQIGELFGKVPMLAVGLGHQLLALSQGGTVIKLPYGHRGGNQPAKAIGEDATYITSQNHGYAVV
ncbi:MAG: carbamoyl phosphate synthase small subunit, partial [Clostridia bacterium]|nr:carbamoyl phosphate synthase small subunit [Clostridia bacterium]